MNVGWKRAEQGGAICALQHEHARLAQDAEEDAAQVRELTLLRRARGGERDGAGGRRSA